MQKAFEEPFEDMQAMTPLAGADGLSIPRRCGRQTQRSNVEATTAEEYWRRTVFVPYLDHLLAELSDRFSTMARLSSTLRARPLGKMATAAGFLATV